MEGIRQLLDSNLSFLGLVLDVKKAFNTVDSGTLLKELEDVGTEI